MRKCDETKLFNTVNNVVSVIAQNAGVKYAGWVSKQGEIVGEVFSAHAFGHNVILGILTDMGVESCIWTFGGFNGDSVARRIVADMVMQLGWETRTKGRAYENFAFAPGF
jgi:hypothetical protein